MLMLPIAGVIGPVAPGGVSLAPPLQPAERVMKATPAEIILPKNFMWEPMEFEEIGIPINAFNSMGSAQYALNASGDYVFSGAFLIIVTTPCKCVGGECVIHYVTQIV
jgi:hypothetical protein